MANNTSHPDAEFRLRPRRPRVVRDENKTWSRSFKTLIQLVRMTSKPAHATRDYFGIGAGTARRNHLQRCAVRVTYSPNRVRGQWAAHGRYLARESATRQAESKGVGFSASADGIDVAKTLNAWQTAGDQRLFKLIISPEFGERLDLPRHTRELLARMERDLGVRLDWVAVAHFNTDHPHVHIALRGQTDAGPLRLDRHYIKRGIRGHAEDLCTAQLGFRTQLDTLEAERREIHAQHATSLDRVISRQAFGPNGDGTFDLDSLSAPGGSIQSLRHHYLAARLRTLKALGLANEIEQGHHKIDPEFLSKLCALQVNGDRQKTQARSLRGVSDVHRPLKARTTER